jgi:hypothetical protein
MSDGWSAGGIVVDDNGRRYYRPKRQPSFEKQLSEAEIYKIVSQFLSGRATQQELANRHGTSVSTIKRLLRKHDARLWVMEQKRVHKRRRSA